MTGEWTVTGYYNDVANALWRHKHPHAKGSGPKVGEVAISVRGPHHVVEMDRQVLEERPDIGRITVERVTR